MRTLLCRWSLGMSLSPLLPETTLYVPTSVRSPWAYTKVAGRIDATTRPKRMTGRMGFPLSLLNEIRMTRGTPLSPVQIRCRRGGGPRSERGRRRAASATGRSGDAGRSEELVVGRLGTEPDQSADLPTPLEGQDGRHGGDRQAAGQLSVGPGLDLQHPGPALVMGGQLVDDGGELPAGGAVLAVDVQEDRHRGADDLRLVLVFMNFSGHRPRPFASLVR